jgi:hypothetical protein
MASRQFASQESEVGTPRCDVRRSGESHGGCGKRRDCQQRDLEKRAQGGLLRWDIKASATSDSHTSRRVSTAGMME